MQLRAVVPLKLAAAAWLIPLVCSSLSASLCAAENWPAVLSRMPLSRLPARELNETNCVPLMLQAFRSNAVVKGIVFLPGAADEFYLVHRARASLTNASPSLFDAVAALTNQTRLRATYQTSLLLLHTAADRLAPNLRIEDPATAEKLKTRLLRKTLCVDRDWGYVQPLLRWPLKLDIRPWQHDYDSYHFYRHNFAAFGLDGWEAISVAALAGKTCVVIRKNQAVFSLDTR